VPLTRIILKNGAAVCVNGDTKASPHAFGAIYFVEDLHLWLNGAYVCNFLVCHNVRKLLEFQPTNDDDWRHISIGHAPSGTFGNSLANIIIHAHAVDVLSR